MFITDQDLIEHGEEFIKHFGVKGMKWGVRKDRIRKGRAEQKINAKIQRKDKWGKSKKATSNSYAERVIRDEIRSKTGAGRLSDAELSARLKRIKMEKIKGQDRQKYRYAPSTHSAYTVDTIRKALPGPRVPARR